MKSGNVKLTLNQLGVIRSGLERDIASLDKRIDTLERKRYEDGKLSEVDLELRRMLEDMLESNFRLYTELLDEMIRIENENQ